MRNHKDLIVWQKSMKLVKELYQISRSFPKEEMYGITSQMRRAAVSIPSNIAEGYGRGHDKELIQFLYVALGSASELETQLVICKEINYLTPEEFDMLNNLNTEVIRMLSSLINKRYYHPC
ncbi:MAG: four helix bundle protein [Bacteroides sp.]|nr:four helix bundle protein [Bacteroides sp.]